MLHYCEEQLSFPMYTLFAPPPVGYLYMTNLFPFWLKCQLCAFTPCCEGTMPSVFFRVENCSWPAWYHSATFPYICPSHRHKLLYPTGTAANRAQPGELAGFVRGRLLVPLPSAVSAGVPGLAAFRANCRRRSHGGLQHGGAQFSLTPWPSGGLQRRWGGGRWGWG